MYNSSSVVLHLCVGQGYTFFLYGLFQCSCSLSLDLQGKSEKQCWKLPSLANLGNVCMCSVVGGVFLSYTFSLLVVRSSFLNIFLVLVHITFSSLTLLSALHSEAPFLIQSPVFSFSEGFFLKKNVWRCDLIAGLFAHCQCEGKDEVHIQTVQPAGFIC